MYHNLFTRSSFNEQLSCFQIVIILHKQRILYILTRMNVTVSLCLGVTYTLGIPTDITNNQANLHFY